MRKKAIRLLCMVLLLAFSLTFLPSCGGRPVTVEFEDAYLPSISLSVNDFSVGMYNAEVDLLLQGKEINVDYVKYANCYFYGVCRRD